MNTCGRPTLESANFEVSNDPKIFRSDKSGHIDIVCVEVK